MHAGVHFDKVLLEVDGLGERLAGEEGVHPAVHGPLRAVARLAAAACADVEEAPDAPIKVIYNIQGCSPLHPKRPTR